MDCTQNCRLRKHGRYLVSAFSSERLDVLKELFHTKCLNQRRNTDEYGRTIFHIVASMGRLNVLKWLCSEVKLGNVLQMKDKESGWTCLHRALYYGHIDCAVFLYNIFHEWRSNDFCGCGPLDLVVLDSPRIKKIQANIKELATAVTQFEAEEAGELSLKPGEHIEIINSNRSGWALGMNLNTKKKGVFPVNFVNKIENRKEGIVNPCFDLRTVLHVWGENVNFNLGLGDCKNQMFPEQLELAVAISDVVISKFHAVILTDEGHVYTCGHGQGGRLGQSNEETVFKPKKIERLLDKCISIKASEFHTVVLDERDSVYLFGLNDYHQLGVSPPPKHCLSPTKLNAKSIKGEKIIGMAVSRFHTAVYTKKKLYTFGLNAGQLGHTKSEHLQTCPKLVSSLLQSVSTISMVEACDNATACLLNSGDLYLLCNYVCRKIALKMFHVKCLSMSNSSDESAQIAVLHGQSGDVEYWSSKTGCFQKCRWIGQKLHHTQVKHISLGRHLNVTTDDGKVYFGYLQNMKNTAPKKMHVPPGKTSVVQHGNLSLKELAEKFARDLSECVPVQLEQVPLVYQAVRLCADSKSRSFAVLQNDPRTGVEIMPFVSPSTLRSDFESIFVNASLEDDVHDAVVKTEEGCVPVHQLFLKASGVDIGNRSKSLEKVCLDLPNAYAQCPETWFQCIYGGESASPPSRNFSEKRKKRVPNGNKDLKKNVEVHDRKNCETKFKHNGLHNWRNFEDISDVKVVSSDDYTFSCHKCVLIGRSEYFCNMLTNTWLETSVVSMRVPRNVLLCVLNYLYVDEPWSKAPDSISFIGEVLTCADQLLLLRLKQICERALACQVNLRNATEIFQFSNHYVSDQLKEYTGSFLTLNLPYYLEARLLNDVDYDDLKELSKCYRKLVHGMDSRVIKPMTVHKEIDAQDRIDSESMEAEWKEYKAKRFDFQRIFNTKVVVNDVKPRATAPPKLNGVSQKNAEDSAMREEKPSHKQIAHFKKKSQKQRKRESQQTSSNKVNLVENCPWNTSALQIQAISLRETSSTNAKCSEPKLKGSFNRPSVNNTRKRLNLKKVELEEISPRQAWNNGVTAPSVPEVLSMAEVQRKESYLEIACAKKPINVIQIEEKAIDELLSHYKKTYIGYDVTVERVKRVSIVPCWEKEMKENSIF